jgi:predicted TIM-barrel enzyme
MSIVLLGSGVNFDAAKLVWNSADGRLNTESTSCRVLGGALFV